MVGLLDTNVVSELRKIRPNRRVKEWSDAQAADAFFLSTITIAEIRLGIERQTDPDFAGSSKTGSTTG